MLKFALAFLFAVPTFAQTPLTLNVTIDGQPHKVVVQGQTGAFLAWIQSIPGCKVQAKPNPLTPGGYNCSTVAGAAPAPAGGSASGPFIVGNPSPATRAALPPGAYGVAFDGSLVPRVPAKGVYYIAADSGLGCIVYSQNGKPEKCLP